MLCMCLSVIFGHRAVNVQVPGLGDVSGFQYNAQDRRPGKCHQKPVPEKMVLILEHLSYNLVPNFSGTDFCCHFF